MKFSENWLRTLVNHSLDSEALAYALTMAGLEVEELAPDLDDKIFTLKLTPNRADCLCVIGVAREVAAITATSLKTEPIKPVATTVSDQLQVKVAEPQACPRYCGRVVRDVDPGAATPAWMARRLERCGTRSLNVLVDITNYVMLERGQPLHAFDLAKIKGGIHVRYGRPAEELVLLNEKKFTLTPNLLLIADEAKPLALAGIMGGLESAVSGKTQSIFLESAFFSPDAVAGKSRLLGFATDSSHRFERGVDFAATREALECATQLILDICGGQAGPVTEASAELPKREPIRLRVPRVRKVLGIALDSAHVSILLRRLQFSFAEEHDVFYVTPPSYRFDLAIEEDLIEELARIHGYDEIPASLPKTRPDMLPLQEARRDETELRKRLVARDYQEIITYSFVEAQWEADFCGNDNPVRLINPMASQMSVMRSSLIASLTDCLRTNLNRKQPRARLFEISRCFTKEKNGYAQPEKLAGLCSGLNLPEQWGAPPRNVDFFDVKADIEALFWPRVPRFVAGRHPALHPGRAAQVWAEGEMAGWVGELNPQWQHKYELPQPPVVFELDLEILVRRELPQVQEISRFPPVRRDIAVVVDARTNVQAMLDSLQAGKPPVVAEIALFDLYQGEGIDSGKKSLAFRVLLQDTQKTMTDAVVEAAVAQLKQILQQEYRAKLRT